MSTEPESPRARQETAAATPPLDAAYLDRFAGIGRLLGRTALERVAAARVVVIGLGGVGSWTVEALARSGVGALTLIDLDDVCVTNTNRQLPALTEEIGRPKGEVLAERVRGINPQCRVQVVPEFLTAANAARLLAGPFDAAVDAIDTMGNKSLLIATAKGYGVPVVTTGSAGGKRDATRIQVGDLSDAFSDELLRQVRKKLRADYGFAKGLTRGLVPLGVRCVWSAEQRVYPRADGTCALEPPEGAATRMDCAGGFGAATWVTGTFGFLAAQEAIGLVCAPAVER